MVIYCSVINCSTNSRGKEKGPTFKLPLKEPLRSQGIGFVGQECSVDENIFICAKHFEEKYLSRNEKRTRLKTHSSLAPIYYTICQFKEVLKPETKESKDE